MCNKNSNDYLHTKYFLLLGNLQDDCIRCGNLFVTTDTKLKQRKICKKCLDPSDSTDDGDKSGFQSERSSSTEEEEEEYESSNGATEYSDK